MRFDGQTAVVVGAGPGLGATLARRFAEQGASVVVAARSASSVDASAAAARDAGAETLAVTADVATIPGARSIAEQAIERFGRLDVLVNTAFAAPPRRTLVEMDDAALESWRATAELGGYGTLLACRFAVPHMIDAGRGSIVNVTSLSSRAGMPGRSDYAAGKAQSHKIAQSLAQELGPLGIRVNSVAPGHIWSDALAGFYRQRSEQLGVTYEEVVASYTDEMALRRIATADEVANAVLFLASDLASAITGVVLDVNAGHFIAP